MSKKILIQFSLFCILTIIIFPLEPTAKTAESVEIDVCIIGGDNHFVYKVPKNLHHNKAYFEMKDKIEQSLSSHWKIQNAYYEANNSSVTYTFFIENLFQMKQNGQLKLSIPYNILVGMFGENEAIQLRIIASKLADWTVNTKEWESLGFVQPLTYLSEREYVYEGVVNELLQQRVGYLDGHIDKRQLIIHSALYFSFILLQMMTCLLLSRRLKKLLLQYPGKMHQFRKLNYTHQLIPLLMIITQVLFVVMSGLITAFGLYFKPGIDLLLIVGPILLNIIVVPLFFVTTEGEISKELRNNSLGTNT